jgi:hypothetical protein
MKPKAWNSFKNAGRIVRQIHKILAYSKNIWIRTANADK